MIWTGVSKELVFEHTQPGQPSGFVMLQTRQNAKVWRHVTLCRMRLCYTNACVTQIVALHT